MIKESLSRKIFNVCNIIFMIVLCFLCLFPIVHILALSFSSKYVAEAGMVSLWPVDFTLDSYKFVIEKKEFFTAFMVTIKRCCVGYIVNMVLNILVAFPLSKEENELRGRKYYVAFFFITMIFNGGLIPTYILVKSLGLLDTVWALVLPGSLSVFNMLILLNYFRSLPKEIGESAYVDGASHWSCLLRIYLPLSMPSIATISIYVLVGHWNEWFSGIIYMNNSMNYPLQSYLRTVVIERDISLLAEADVFNAPDVSDRTMRAAQIFVATLPILLVYPMFQKHFVKGMMVGSVKG